MKIAITAQGKELASPVDARFGRAKYFVVFDDATETTVAQDNSQNVNAAQGAGIQAAQNVSALGVEAVITGNVGPKAFRTLKAAGIRIFTGASGSVADAVSAMKAGRLTETQDATVEGHWM